MTGLQTPLTPEGVLDNALSLFDRLSTPQKDEFIKRYEGESPNFQDV